jgi:hypothetical protein
MSVKNFKFVSPGVFINEIDNSFIPKSAEAIGPVVVGRARRGLAMQPIQVQAYSDFVEMFGDTVPGMGGGDIYRNGNYQSPMYGTYAAKAFLRANVAPLTYIRLLGQQSVDNDGTNASKAGWKTTQNPTSVGYAANGGAYGLWVWPSSSAQGAGNTAKNIGTGSLAAIWYLDDATIRLSGTAVGGRDFTTGACGTLITMDSSNLFTVLLSGSARTNDTIKFGFDDSADTFIRKRFNTNPQLVSNPNTFYPTSVAHDYWLGETFEQGLRWGVGTSGLMGAIYAIASGSSLTTGPHNMKGQASAEAKAGWFIGQDLSGDPASYSPSAMTKLFRLIGRGHGEWLHKNCKVSIENIKQSTSTVTDYGTFSVVIRKLKDTDNNVIVMERFDNCTLDPTAPNFVARKIGDQYYQWDTASKRLKLYGEYPNNSKFVYLEATSDVEAGATDPLLLPFGYFSPPRFATAVHVTSSQGWSTGLGSGSWVQGGTNMPFGPDRSNVVVHQPFLSGATRDVGAAATNGFTGSFSFPTGALRVSSSDGGLSDPTTAYFGFSSVRTPAASTSPISDNSVADFNRMLFANAADDPTTNTDAAFDGYGYVFSLDDVVQSGSSNTAFYYMSGARALSISYSSASYTNLLNANVNRFTAPFWGGVDGFDITVPDPMYNKGMDTTSTEENSYIYTTWKRAVNTVSDPEFVNMNLLSAPGLTLDNLTGHMINVCEDRADAMALIDIADVYLPSHEIYKSSKTARVGTTPNAAATALKNREIDSSYGATFYPWVQTRDEDTGRLLWVPPSVAMMGVLASSQASSELWFAPAGFNRGGLSEGAAGIPVTSVSERVTSRERDVLYDANINPIASFPSSGIVVFGQKTLQQRRSALDRINVRRLVIYLKKQISVLSTQVLFEQNVEATWNRFIGLIDPLLANVKSRFGLTDYRLILDESTTTPDLIDQNILYAKIMVKPARAIEFIAIDFVIMSTGASFDD